MPANRPRRLVLLMAILIPLAAPACSGPSMNPKVDRARAALDASLSAWRDGKKPGPIAGTDPPVHVADNEWTLGRKLAAFEVLREQASEGDKRFVVKLTYAPASIPPTEAVYVVLGASPIAVFREEDYNRTLNMDNNPTEKTKKARR